MNSEARDDRVNAAAKYCLGYLSILGVGVLIQVAVPLRQGTGTFNV